MKDGPLCLLRLALIDQILRHSAGSRNRRGAAHTLHKMTVESGFVAAFVDKAKRDRWTEGLPDARIRPKLLERLWNSGSDWDARHVTPLRLTGKRPEQIAAIVTELRHRGAGKAVHVISVDDDLDGRSIPLDEAVDHFADDGGAVIICGPGLALHFPESGPPLLLSR